MLVDARSACWAANPGAGSKAAPQRRGQRAVQDPFEIQLVDADQDGPARLDGVNVVAAEAFGPGRRAIGFKKWLGGPAVKLDQKRESGSRAVFEGWKAFFSKRAESQLGKASSVGNVQERSAGKLQVPKKRRIEVFGELDAEARGDAQAFKAPRLIFRELRGGGDASGEIDGRGRGAELGTSAQARLHRQRQAALGGPAQRVEGEGVLFSGDG